MKSLALLHRTGVILLACGVALTSVLAFAVGGTAAVASRNDGIGAAPGAPGTMSCYDLATKDCAGTAAGRGRRPGSRSRTGRSPTPVSPPSTTPK
jgi:hypothetical protein